MGVLTRRGGRWRSMLAWVAAMALGVVVSTPLAGCERSGAPRPAGEAALTGRQAELLLKTLADAPEHGFAPSAFPIAGLAEQLRSGDARIRDAAEGRLRSEAIAYAQAQHGLAVPRGKLDPNWGMRPARYDAAAGLRQALAQDQLAQWVASLPPPDPRYEQLRQGYLAYLRLVKAGGWPQVPAGPVLKPGAQGPRVVLLRRRLSFEDAAVAAGPGGAAYDQGLQAAVVRFQTRHGLEPTGVVDDKTLAALNVPAIARAAQIRANLERWRWAPRQPAATRIEVNSVAGEMDLYLDGAPAMHMLAAAGKPGDETPILTSEVHTVVLNPTWNVPDSIAHDELYPKQQANPDYFSTHHFVVDDGRLIQQPGPENALGRVKFLFDNDYSIYLHDTPAKATFNQAERTVSHGCVRLEHAIELAKRLLNRELGWAPERVDEVLQGEDTQSIALPKHIPVSIYYWTAYPDGGQISFRDDIYGWDQELLRQLDAAESGHA